MSDYLIESTETVHRAAQPYVGVRRTVTMETICEISDRVPELFAWLAERGVVPAGPPFLRYLVIDMSRELVIEAGVPVAAEVTGDDDVALGVLPEGSYVVATVLGHPDTLIAATAEVLDWAQARELTWDVEPSPEGDRWGCRLETYLTNPAEEPDMTQWRTELAFRLRD